MRATLALVVLTTLPAAADNIFESLGVADVVVADPDDSIDAGHVKVAIERDGVNGLSQCTHQPGVRVLVWLVFDGGKVVVADAAGSGDRKLEACIVKSIKLTKLAGSKARVAARVVIGDSSFGPPSEGRGTGVYVGNTMGSGGTSGGTSERDFTVGRGCDKIDGELAADSVSRVIRAHYKAFHACYDNRIKDRPDLPGKILISFTISAAGLVTEAKVSQSLEHNLDACMVRQIKALRFPTSTGTTRVEYPFVVGHGAPHEE
jgi:hypothetical protein